MRSKSKAPTALSKSRSPTRVGRWPGGWGFRHLVRAIAARASDRSTADSARGANCRDVAARAVAPFTSAQELAGRAQLGATDMAALAAAGALRPIAGHRHRASWEVAGIERPSPRAPLWREIRIARTPYLRFATLRIFRRRALM